jgi:hypothetical protein
LNLWGCLPQFDNNGRRAGAQRLTRMMQPVRLLPWKGKEHLTGRHNSRIYGAAADRLCAIDKKRSAKDRGKLVTRRCQRPANGSWRCRKRH